MRQLFLNQPRCTQTPNPGANNQTQRCEDDKIDISLATPVTSV